MDKEANNCKKNNYLKANNCNQDLISSLKFNLGGRHQTPLALISFPRHFAKIIFIVVMIEMIKWTVIMMIIMAMMVMIKMIKWATIMII